MKNKILSIVKNKLFISITWILIAVLWITWVIASDSSKAQLKTESQRKIIVFESSFTNENAKDKLIEYAWGVKIKNLDLINAKAIYLPSKASENALKKNIWVLRIEDDVIVKALWKWKPVCWNGILERKESCEAPDYSCSESQVCEQCKCITSDVPTPSSQVTPWWIDRIDADLVWDITGNWVKVAIIDTWIDLRHPDLKDNIKWSYNTINSKKSANDDNWHWTHVAWTVAALDNNTWVIWVWPQINLYAVKALDRNGNGYLSDVIEWLDWAINNWIQVVNMSLSTTSNILSFQEAVQRANQAWIIQVAAAWNDWWSVNYPAAYADVIAVSATDKNDIITSWSSRWLEIDLSAPWVEIYSTYKWKTYKNLQWTSMASPHVAWAAALVLTTSPWTYDLNSDWNWNPNEVQNKLEASAEDLWDIWKDTLYWAWLVDVEKAVQ